MADPRKPRGIRHTLVSVLVLAAAAVVAGLAIAVLRRAGHPNIAAGLRWTSYSFTHPAARSAR